MNGEGASSRKLDDLLVGIDERDLADLIEGQIDADRRHDLETMLIKRPELRRLVEAMRHDRAVTRAMPDEFCQVDVAAGVRDVLEREALLGAAQAAVENEFDEYAPAPIAISTRRSASRQFALAAGLLLLVGGGAFLAWPYINKPSGNSGGGPNGNAPIAINDSTKDAASRAKQGPGATSGSEGTGPTIAANAEKSREEAAVPGVGETGVVPGPIAANVEDTSNGGARAEAKEGTQGEVGASALAMNDTEAGELVGPAIPAELVLARAVEPPIDETRAAELAQEGRLLVRVQGASAAYVLSTSASRGSLGSHRVDRVEPSELASPVLAQVFEGATTPEQIMWASDHAMPVYDREVVGPEGYVVEFAATAQGLAKLREELGGRVTFEELPEDAGLRPRIDPDAVLWWTLPPSSWAPRVAAPIILEH
ncbi:MAG: hypothetical protein IT434_14740 [Phycisphaerales bacterium]|jgi:hypothetical protein|nr:hypothetical protein [Phycisphaerales bacterium]